MLSPPPQATHTHQPCRPAQERVTTSIQLYHLDHFKTVDRRQQLYQTTRSKVDQAEDMLRKFREKADMTAQQSLGDVVKERMPSYMYVVCARAPASVT